MSKERAENEYGHTSKEIKKDLLDYLRGSVVNTAKYQAFLDYKSETELNSTLGGLIERINRRPFDLQWYEDDSQLRITENRIARLEDSIEQKKMTIPDYEEAYTTIWCNFDELEKVLCEEGKRKYPESDEEIDVYIEKVWGEVMDDVKLELLDNS
jgi:hypothetical protein